MHCSEIHCGKYRYVLRIQIDYNVLYVSNMEYLCDKTYEIHIQVTL